MPRGLPASLTLALLAMTPARAGAECAPLRCLDGRAAIAPRGPNQFTLEAGVALGFFYSTHATVRLGYGRRFWDRIEVEATAQLGFAEIMLSISEGVRAGVLLHLGTRMDLLLGWRVGYTHVRKTLPGATIWVGAIWVSMLVEARVAISPALELRIAPLVATGYWNEIWGFTLDPGIGLSFRF